MLFFRSAQRAIAHFVVEALVAVGLRDHDHRAKERFIKRVGREVGERFSSCYCVLDSHAGQEVITVGWMNVRRTTDAQPPHRRARRHH